MWISRKDREGREGKSLPYLIYIAHLPRVDRVTEVFIVPPAEEIMSKKKNVVSLAEIAEIDKKLEQADYLPLPEEVAPRDEKGRLLPGAQLAKMRRRTYDLDELKIAIRTVEKRRKKKLLEHFIDRAFKNDTVLIALLKKFVPDITIKDIRNTGNPFNVFITKFLTGNVDIPKEEKIAENVTEVIIDEITGED